MLTQRVERLRALEGLPGAVVAVVAGLVLDVKECSSTLAHEVTAGLESSSRWEEGRARVASSVAAEEEKVVCRVRVLESELVAKNQECARLRQVLEERREAEAGQMTSNNRQVEMPENGTESAGEK
jgi:hypothetical protein